MPSSLKAMLFLVVFCGGRLPDWFCFVGKFIYRLVSILDIFKVNTTFRTNNTGSVFGRLI